MYRLAQRKGRCVQISYDDGKTWKSTGCYTKEEARARLKLGHIHTLGEYAKDFFIRTDDDSLRYRMKQRGQRIDDRSLNKKQYRLDKCIIPVFGKRVINEIKAREIEGWLFRLKSPKGEKYTNNVKNEILCIFRVLLDNALADGLVDSNEARKIKNLKAIYNKRPSLSLEEINILLPQDDEVFKKHFKNLYVRTYFAIFRDTGFRPSEILALRRSDIREDGTVYTEWMYDTNTHTIEHRIKTTGTGKDYKVGKLSEQSLRFISQTEGEYIFYDNRDKFDMNTMNRKFKSACKKYLHKTGYTQYCIRHYFMTNLISKYPKELIMELMGHTTWESCYDDRTPDMILDNLRKALSQNQA